MGKEDIIGVADALTVILYVTYGAGAGFGIDLDKCFKEVHSSNMSKLDRDGRPIYREDGKILKGPDYFEPNLEKIVDNGIQKY
jgi:predicted HAD superfamily Cof-like phosphohydrolase